MDDEARRIQAFDSAIAALAEFRRVFGRALSEGIVAEMYAARDLGLTLNSSANAAGSADRAHPTSVERAGPHFRKRPKYPNCFSHFPGVFGLEPIMS
jgi:hypothetical protein